MGLRWFHGILISSNSDLDVGRDSMSGHPDLGLGADSACFFAVIAAT
jgi:hypothetical protein